MRAGGAYLLDAVAGALIRPAAFGTNRPSSIGSALSAVFVGVLLDGLTMLTVLAVAHVTFLACERVRL